MKSARSEPRPGSPLAPSGEPSGVTGRFVVVEGIEGSGKTTQAARLARWLAARGVSHLVTREPGGTPVGEAIRGVVLDRPGLAMPAETELLLILAARSAFVRQVVQPALERGEVVVADRYEPSTVAYQGYGRGLDIAEVGRLNRFATAGLRPDLTLILDVPVELGTARQRREGKEADRMESEGRAFLERVREGYLAIARDDPGTVLVDASGSPEEVHRSVVAAVEELFGGTFGASGD